MKDTINNTLHEWIKGKSPLEARIEIFNRIRDIPYAVIHELNDSEHYVNILEFNRGSCTPKHFLLANMYDRIGLRVLYVVYPYKWDEFEDLYPPDLVELAREMPVCFHLACRVEIDGKLVYVDATLDPALAAVGLPVNKDWDGISDTMLPVNPCGEEQIYHTSEAYLMQAQNVDEKATVSYERLNSWMDKLRTGIPDK